jgi:hypothetical protein
MNALVRKIVTTALVLALVAGITALMTSPDTNAKGKKPKPDPCPWCDDTIIIGGMECTLDACGFDCVYSCPLPFP